MAGRPRVVYSGEPGAFAEEAAQAAFPDIESEGLPGFRQVFEAVTRDEADVGVVPIENLVNGTVREVYDLLLEHDLAITGEVVVPVRLSLAASPGERLEDIERVYSHIQALGQAERFLRTRPWVLLTTYNTAGAGRMVADGREPRAAAVLSPRAAALFGLEILEDGIADVPDNRTRFLLVQAPDAPAAVTAPAGRSGRPPMRTTLVFAIENRPGTLHSVLEIFRRHGLNMSKLESRPSREHAWEYVFWADLDADAAEPATAEALDELAGVTTMLRSLGTYPRSDE
jgi:prephenate dehydratase